MGHETTKEYGQGYTAFEEGKSILSNPYIKGTSAAYRWQSGWYDAKEDLDQAQVGSHIKEADLEDISSLEELLDSNS